MMKNSSGFTLMEVMIVIAIIAILSAVAVPNMIRWRNGAKFNGAVNTLAGDLAWAKQSAIRLNEFVSIGFTANAYTIFVDDGGGGGTAADGIQNGTEQILRNRTMPAGVTIDLAATTFANNSSQFNGRGRCSPAEVGTVFISQGAAQRSIAVNRLGRIDVI